MLFLHLALASFLQARALSAVTAGPAWQSWLCCPSIIHQSFALYTTYCLKPKPEIQPLHDIGSVTTLDNSHTHKLASLSE